MSPIYAVQAGPRVIVGRPTRRRRWRWRLAGRILDLAQARYERSDSPLVRAVCARIEDAVFAVVAVFVRADVRRLEISSS